MNNETDKIIEVINQLRPFLNSEGGDIKFIKYDDGFVYVKLYGACMMCEYKDFTIQDNIFEAIKAEVPDVKGVINVEL